MVRVRQGEMGNLQMGVKAHMSLDRGRMTLPSMNKDPPLAALQLLLSCSSFSEVTHTERMFYRFRVTLAVPHDEHIETCNVNHFESIDH